MKIISIIIPSYNEENHIAYLLRDLADQDFTMNLVEIIVVDNDSSDSTVYKVNKFINDNPELAIILVKEYNPGVSYARNKGAQYSTGEVLIFLDADNIVGRSFVKSIYQKFFVEKYQAGTICTLAFETLIGHIIFFILEKIKIIFKRPFGKSFCSKRIFEQVQGFNVVVGMAGTNLDFLLRVKKQLKKEHKKIGHIKTPIYASLRRFETDGYWAILFKWFLAYIGFKKIPYQRK